MTQREINSLRMLKAVLLWMHQHEDLWKDIEDIVESVTYIELRVQKMEKESGERLELDTAPITEELHVNEGKAIALAYLMSKRLKLFAGKMGLTGLKHEVDFSKTALGGGDIEERIERLKLIAKRAQENLVAAGGLYKIKQVDITALTTLIALYEVKPAERKVVVGEGVESTAAFKQLLKEAMVKVDEELDDEVEVLMEDEATVAAYFAVRRTDDNRARGKGK